MPYSEYHANLHQYRQWAKRQGEFFRRIQHVDTGRGEKMMEKGAELSLIES
jgi:tRNA A37 N6-isopentenylltransferase MiaA